MLSLKINSKYFLPLFLIFSNFWIYKILNQNLFVGIVLAVLSLTIVLNFKTKIYLLCFFLLVLMQFQTTSIKSLTLLDNDEQRVQSERMRSYPLTFINLGIKVIWLKPATWIEKNNFVIAISRLEENLFNDLDFNKYFFGGFPRNKPEDFEKFPFFYLLIFIFGVFIIVKKKMLVELGFFLIAPLILLTFIGNDNKLGPFMLFPFFIKTFFEGVKWFREKFSNTKIFFIIFAILISAGFILQISYAKP